MLNLTAKQAANLAELIDAHDDVVRALKVVNKRDRVRTLSIASEEGNDDYCDVTLTPDQAQAILGLRLRYLEDELKKVGVKLK